MRYTFNTMCDRARAEADRKGTVEMAVEDALDPDDKANGIILACQAKPTEDVTVEA